MKKYLILLFAFAFMVSCADKVEQKEAEPAADMSGNHPPMGGMDALSELSEEMPPIDPTNPLLELANINMTAPDSWLRENPTSTMRVVQYSLKSSPESKVVGFFFGQQDMVKENIDRWKGEFAELKDIKEEKMMNGDIDFITLKGVFKVKHFAMAEEAKPTPGYMVLAAIVKSSDGPYYFKIAAPEEVLNKEIDNFKKFLNSYKVKS